MAETNQKHRIGIFGIGCTGKTTLVNGLRALGYENLFENSALIENPAAGGVTAGQFRESSKKTQLAIRGKVIAYLTERGRANDVITIGQFSTATIASGKLFHRRDGEMVIEDIFNESDRGFYTEIILVRGDSNEIRSRFDAGEAAEPGKRPKLSKEQIGEWHLHEEDGLIKVCRDARILLHWFKPLPGNENAERNAQQFAKLVDAIRGYSEAKNQENIERHMDRMFGKNCLEHAKSAPVFVLIDGDCNTLQTTSDVATRFWAHAYTGAHAKDFEAIFKTLGGSDHFAFRQAAAMYAKLSTNVYESACEAVVSEIELRPEFVEFLKFAIEAPQFKGVVVPIVITSTNVDIWNELLAERDIGEGVAVIGGHLTPSGGSFILDPRGKGLCAKLLRQLHPRCRILASGVSDADLDMFEVADEGFLVVDDKSNESLRYRLRKDDAYTVQIKRKLTKLVLQESASFGRDNGGARDEVKLLKSTTFAAIRTSLPPGNFKDFSESNVSKLFATEALFVGNEATRLFAVHKQIGAYVGACVVEDMELGAAAHRYLEGAAILDASKTAIVAMMRSGEATALGIWELPFFNRATFIHCNSLSDLNDKAAVGIRHFIVVDALINSGHTIRGVLNHVIGINAMFKFRTKISVVAVVVQHATAASLPFEYPAVKFYALRTADSSHEELRNPEVPLTVQYTPNRG